MYLSFAEYQSMGGTLDETTFTDLEYEAEVKIDWYTFNRLHNNEDIPDRVKKCVYVLIKLINEAQTAKTYNTDENGVLVGASVASQSNDGVSISYNTLSVSDAIATIQDDIKETINTHLQGVVNEAGRKLLYRGLYPGE